MMTYQNNKTLRSLCAVALASALLAACGSSPSARFYTLTAPATASTAGAVAARGPQTFIEVMPVAVPDRLARPQLVVRSDAAQLDVLEQDRWSSPFNSELRDALAAGVASRLGAIDISRSGRPADQVSYRITVELRDLDALRNGRVQASFGWTITRSDDRRSAACRMTVVEPVAGAATGDVVLATQKAVASVADAIAANVRTMQGGQGAQCSG